MDPKELYSRKNELLAERCGNPVKPADFYRELFPVGSFERAGRAGYDDHKGNGIALSMFPDGRKVRTTITDDLDMLETLAAQRNVDRVVLAPVSYFGKKRNANNLRYVYAIVIDLDGVERNQCIDVLYQAKNGVIPTPTFVVNSGNGLHLYFQFDEPVPAYPNNRTYLKELKKGLIRECWNRYTSTIEVPQVQGITQPYRLIGSVSKLGADYPVVAYQCGNKFSVDELESFVVMDFVMDFDQKRVYAARTKKTTPMEEAKERWPEWYERRIVNGCSKGHWIIKRDLYDWWLRQIRGKAKVGHRYYCILCLAAYAVKCGIPEDELRRDAESLLQPFDRLTETEDNHFTMADIDAALLGYNPEAATFPKDDISKMCAIQMPINRRNGRPQSLHLTLARATKAALKAAGAMKPEGRPSMQATVATWRKAHPNGRKIDCQRDTGLDPKTIRKWWTVSPSTQPSTSNIKGGAARGKETI